jgi:hypothetical protein
MIKFLFPKTTRGDRQRAVRAIFYWLIGCMIIIAAVCGVLYLAYERGVR